MLTKIDKSIISLISYDIPLVERPFERLAVMLGIKEGLLLKRIRAYKKKGLMRKFSASLNQRKVGFKYNAMAVWNIPEGLIAKAAKLLVSLSEVSHCYERKKASGWNYNFYAMIHGKTKNDCLNVVGRISKELCCKDYKVLFSTKEYKKIPVKY